VKPAPFAYHRAHSVAEAVALLAELGDEAKILAGGLSLVPMMNFRLARPTALVDVSRINDLSYLRATPAGADPADPTKPTGLRIGALTTHRAVEISRDPAVLNGFGVLPRSARWIGHYPIRSRGTFGGSIAHADPASEWCLLAVLLAARIVLTGPAGQRTVPAAEFFEGYYSTAAGPDEMITEIWFPEPAERAVLTEFAPRQGDFAVVAAAVSADIADGVCRSGRVVLGGVGPLPVEVNADPLSGQPATGATWQAMGEHAAGQINPSPSSSSPFTDAYGDAGFRRRLTATLVSRGLAEVSLSTDIPGGVERRFPPGLKAGVSTPQS
jgi:carbon-monoxide dehydrogenase medium subunit